MSSCLQLQNHLRVIDLVQLLIVRVFVEQVPKCLAQKVCPKGQHYLAVMLELMRWLLWDCLTELLS